MQKISKLYSIKKFTILVSLFIFLFGYGVASGATVEFKTDLSRYSELKEEVKLLQAFLSTQGFYTGTITGNYLTQTYQAVVKFQSTYGIIPANGEFGASSRAKANQMLAGNSTLANDVVAKASGAVTTTVQPTVTTSTPTPTVISNQTPTASASMQSITTTSVSVPTAPNLVTNPSLEEVNGTKPNRWFTGKWGTNTATFTYPVAGSNSTKGAGIKMTAYTSGDAKWYFEDVAVTPGATYTFTESYKSNVITNVTARWKKIDGTLTYQSLGNPSASVNWTTRTITFTVPANVTSVTIFHVLRSVGTLDIDNFSITTNSTTVPVATNATVSAWTAWVPVSGWSVCVNGTQSRTEERTRTVLSVATGSGSTPALKELRTVTQSCSTTTPVTPTTPTTPTTPSTTTPTNPITPNTLNFPKKEWGAYTGWQESSLDDVENIVGAEAKYRAVFIHWGNEKNFPTYLKPYVKDKGKTLVIFWEATNYNVGTVNQANYSYDAILNGNFDSYIAQFAADAKAYGGEVILIPFSEMNGDWFPWSITQNNNSGQKHIDAWRRIREAFRGATNVKFGWAPNHDAVPDTSVNQFEKFYPGDAYVDYVGLDGFNFNYPWMTFDQIFKEGLAKMKVYNKPVYIFSFASAEGAQKGAWVTDALTVQMQKYPEIKGWIWFHENKERDWRINSDSSALSAFKQALPLTLPFGL